MSSSSLVGGGVGRSGLSASLSSLAGGEVAEVALVSSSGLPFASVPGGASVARDRSRTQVARDNNYPGEVITPVVKPTLLGFYYPGA